MKYSLAATLSPLIVNGEHLRRITQIDSIDFTAVGKKAKALAADRGKVLSDEYVERGILALKQYYAVAVIDPANGHAVSPAVDLFWHAHMLFSHDYTAQTVSIVGQYMHHAPLDHDDAAQVAKAERLYAYTMTVFDKIFRRVDRKFWPATLGKQDLICMHFGNSIMYLELQAHRMFEPNEELAVSA